MALLRNRDAYFLVNVVRDVGKQFDFRVESFSISPGELGEPTEVIEKKGKQTDNLKLETVPVKLTLIGPGEKHINLISAIEKALPILTVNGVEIDVKQGVAELKMEVSTSFRPEPGDYQIKALALKDLTLKDEEMKLIEQLAGFNKIAGVTVDEDGLMKKGEYVRYEGRDPFGR